MSTAKLCPYMQGLFAHSKFEHVLQLSFTEFIGPLMSILYVLLPSIVKFVPAWIKQISILVHNETPHGNALVNYFMCLLYVLSWRFLLLSAMLSLLQLNKLCFICRTWGICGHSYTQRQNTLKYFTETTHTNLRMIFSWIFGSLSV